MDAPRGAFFVIEGTDGSGKATQFALLKERLERAGYSVATFDFPQYDQPSSYFVRRYLDGNYGSAEKVGPYAGSLFYALDRYETATAMRDAMSKGYIVLANRFTGSNMAHQGAKFSNPSERRGYYIWLDSLEYMVLGIPRPDLNFVLRVPAKIARAFAEKRAEQQNPDKSIDLHEADFSHIETSVLVYDELCQLFPKDFKQIDCVRNSALMSVDQIQQMVWETLQPYLPPVPTERLASRAAIPKTTHTPEVTVETAKTKTARVSMLTAATIDLPKQPYVRIKSKSKPYYIPSTIKDTLREKYIVGMDSLFELYDEMLHRVPPEHTTYVQSVLPVATLQEYDMPEASIDKAARLNTPEARVLRAALQIKESKGPSAFTRGNTIARMASDVLPSSYAQTSVDTVRLVSVSPRNELDVVPLILYPSSALPLSEIMNITAEWHYEQKATIYLANIATGTDTSNALASVMYDWDIIVPFETIRDIKRIAPEAGMVWQLLSPRLGYEVPEEIESAGLIELFERSYDTSLEIYSDLQATGLFEDAQYALLNGHFVRCTLRIDGWTLRNIAQVKTDIQPQTKRLFNDLVHRAAQTHPLLYSDMQQS